MKKLISTIIFLILTNAIYADGIIPDLAQYLTRYPDRIDEQGWVTIPSNDLRGNNEDFNINCQYRLVHTINNNVSIVIPDRVNKNSFFFKTATKGNYLHRIQKGDKNKILKCKDGFMETVMDSLLQVVELKQLSPESIKYARNKHLKSMLPSSSYNLAELIVNMNREIKYLKKEANKNCCQRYCAIL